MPRGTKCFEDPSLLDERERFRALSINGVAQAMPRRDRLRGVADCRAAARRRFHRRLGFARRRLQPWNLVEGSIEALAIPKAVAVDQSYFDRLGISGVGATAEIREQKVQVAAVTKGIRSFTTTPYVFTDARSGARLHGDSPNKATYFLVPVAPTPTSTAFAAG